MSDRKNNLKNLIKKAFVSTSMAATFVLTGETALGAAFSINRNTIGNDFVLSTGNGLDQNGGVDVAYDSNTSVLTYTNLYTGHSDVTQIGSIYITPPAAHSNLVVEEDAILGIVVPTAINLGNDSLNLFINNGKSLTLNGVAPTVAQAQSMVAADGSANPFAAELIANNKGVIPTDTYFLNSIDFQNGNGVLNIDTTANGGDGGDIIFAAPTTNTTLANAVFATLNVKTNLQLRNSIWANIGTVNISDSKIYKFIFDTENPDGAVNLQPTNADPNGGAPINSVINFLGPNSEMDFSSENPTNTEFKSDTPIISATDLYGIVDVHVSTAPVTISASFGASNTQRLNSFFTDGLNQTTITGNIFAQKIYIVQNPYDPEHDTYYQPPTPGAAQLIWTTAIDTSDGKGNNGLIQFSSTTASAAHPQTSEFQKNITSDMDLNGTDATVTFDNGTNVTGKIDNVLGGGTNILNFMGDSTVSGDIGDTNPINTININGASGTEVQLQNVKATNFVFNNTGAASVATLTATAVDFGTQAATLIFSSGNAYTFSSPISGAQNGTIQVDNPNLIATDASFVTAKNIKIGDDPSLTLTIDSTTLTNATLGLLTTPGSSITFTNAGSTLDIAPPNAQTVVLNGTIDGFTGGGGNVTLDGTNGGLTIQGAGNGVGIFGTTTNPLTTFKTIGNVTANAINIANFTNLNITGGSTLIDNSLTSAGIANINIGDNTGLATYELTPTINFNLNTAKMTFGNVDSVLNIQSTGAVIAALSGDLDPGAQNSGIIALTSTGGLLTLQGAYNLGIESGNLLNSITFAGTGDITVEPTINTNPANPILTGITGNLTLTTVNAPITFNNTTTLRVSVVTGQIDLAGKVGVLNINDGGQVSNIISTNGPVGETVNLGAGGTSGNIDNITNVTIGDGATTGDIIGCTTIVFQGAGTANSIQNATTVDFSDIGKVVLTNDSSATIFTILQNGTVVSDNNNITGDVVAGAGEFNAGNIDGNVSVTTGSINSGTITGTVTFGGNGNVTATTIDEATDLAGKGGTLNINAGGQASNITSTGGPSGETVNLGANAKSGNISNIAKVIIGDGGVTGDIINSTDIEFNGTGQSSSIQDATTVNFNGAAGHSYFN